MTDEKVDHPACPVNRIDPCGWDTYDPARPPRDDCAVCWARYNVRHDLPAGNRTPRSRFRASTLDPPAYPSRWFPTDVVPIEGGLGRENIPAAARDVREVTSPCVVGVDVGLNPTGVAVVGLDRDAGALRLATGTVGFGIPQGAPPYDVENRREKIVTVVANVVDIVSRDDGVPRVGLEDHAYSRNMGGTAELHELHGALKFQLYLRTGRAVDPIGISSGRKEAFGNGGAQTEDVRAAMIERWGAWAEGITEHEVDALVVAAAQLRRLMRDFAPEGRMRRRERRIVASAVEN